ncbi:hypothetical protein OEZ85_011005 [Tetradesmus obliquus]|uniref:SET domain-containing protein n=1 Tax=Tetradesmus obliquus TaxID=3088 RepID=A0ABY8TNY4_TETOB|nr:hypothetical protein OEZ85_011005 [Tetradesmus obliquus]
MYATVGDGVEVRASTIANAGNGLFASAFFDKGTLITEYCGKAEWALEEQQKPASQLTHHRARGDGWVIAGLQTQVYGLGGASFANDPIHDRSLANSRLVNKRDPATAGVTNRVFLQASADIAPGQEIFVSYGNTYWKRSSSHTCPVCRKLPLSGSEPAFSMMPWGTKQGVTGSNCYDYSLNDYRNHRPAKTTPGDKAWDAPTRLLLRQHAKFDKCQDVVPGILADNPGSVYREAASNPCKQGYSKIQAYVGGPSDDGFGDFHFYRQNKDVEYVTEAGDTPAKVAGFLGIPVERVLDAAAGSSSRTTRHRRDAALPVGTTLLLRDANVWSHKAGWATGALLKDSCGKAIHDPRRACRSHAVDYSKYCGSYCVKVGATTTAQRAPPLLMRDANSRTA